MSGNAFGGDPFDGSVSFNDDEAWDWEEYPTGGKGDSQKNEQNASRRPTSRLSSSRHSESKSSKKPSKKPPQPPATSSRKAPTSSSAPRSSASPNRHGDTRKSRSSSRGDGRGRSRSSSVGHSQQPSGRSRSKSRTREDRSSSLGPGDNEAPSGLRRGTKPDRMKSKQASSKPTASEIAAAFDTDSFDASFGANFFAKATVSSTAQSRIDDGFADFAAFPTDAKPSGSNHDGFEPFADFGDVANTNPAGRQQKRSSQGPRHSGVTGHSLMDDGALSRHSTRVRRTGSGGNEHEIGLSLHASREPRAANVRPSRQRSDPSSRLGPSERVSRNDRRKSDQDTDRAAVSLGNYLVDVDKTKGPKKARDNASIHSAPAVIVNRDRSLRSSARGSLNMHRDDLHTASSVVREEPRRPGRRVPSKNSANGPPKHEPLKLDIAELAKQGYLEVHDGKMRLVIDVESDAY